VANLEWVEEFHGHQSQMQKLHICAVFIMEQKGILLLLSYCQKCNQVLEGTMKEYVLWSLLGIMDICETGGYVGSGCLIGCDVIWSGRWILVLQRNLLAPSAEHWTAWHRITSDCHLLWVLIDAALFVFYELFCEYCTSSVYWLCNLCVRKFSSWLGELSNKSNYTIKPWTGIAQSV
jgi:hypothetical protein